PPPAQPAGQRAQALMALRLRQRMRARFDRWVRRRTPAALPVRFDRHRIYVLPTGFGAFFTMLLLTMGLGALNYNNNPALLLCLMLAGAAIASLLQAQLQLGGLEVHAIGAEPVAAGTPLQLRVHVRAAPGRGRRGLRVDCAGSRAVLSLDEGAGGAAPAPPTRPPRRRARGRLQAQLQRGGLEVHAIGAEPVAAGTPLQLRVHVRAAPGRVRRGLRVDCAGSRAVLSLDEGAGEAVLALPTRRRGWLDPGRVR